ncbi:MAG TPA: pimeloyl-ACP methyl ester esterase BioH [Novimethylophilus sp.]|jgi:pimeloyl-[acyl-carrier protein] methyl ester esterase|uniref:pimeloyl-ACP methyl ester esterase BioH n=1 Tax=Novimethylophilus sp. TaxID=2137426 RepID=UPI002F3E748E
MSLHVETLGQGPDLVLLHGWGMHGGVWAPVAKQLAASFRLHIVDLPGLGHSAAVAPYTLENLAAAVARIAPPGAIACGWSLGGQVVLRWAMQQPQHIARLVLVGSTPRFVSGGDWQFGVAEDVFREFAAQVRQDYRATLSRFLALQAYGGDAAKETVRQLREHFFERDEPAPQTLQAGLDVLLATDLRAGLGAVTAPALVLHGDYDKLAPVEAGRWLAQHLPCAQLRVCNNASHAPFLSHPAWFVDVLREFCHG